MGIRRALTATCAALVLLLSHFSPWISSKYRRSRCLRPRLTSAARISSGIRWFSERLRRDAADSSAPYVVCAEYSEGREALDSLETNFNTSVLHRVSNSEMSGSCFIMTASPSAAADMLSAPAIFSLLSAVPFLPSLKLASGMLDHESDVSDRSGRLRSTYGKRVSPGDVRGLSARLSPGILPAKAMIQ